MEENASVYQVNTVSRITAGRERVGQVNLCVETINPSCGGWKGKCAGGGQVRGERALGSKDIGFAIRVVLGLGNYAGGGEGGGVGGEGGWNCSSGMDGSKTITRRYPGRGSAYYSGGFRY